MRFNDTDRAVDPSGREALETMLATRAAAPATLTRSKYAALSADERSDYNDARVAWLSGGIIAGTPSLHRAKTTIRSLMSQNLRRNSGHLGLMISGDSTLGKTFISEAVMKYTYRAYEKQFPDFRSAGRVPVVRIEVPAGCTGKLLMIAFAQFFGISHARSETADAIRHRVVDALNAARTQLIVVDELHNLTAANRGNGESIDILKSLHNQVPALFVYLGIDLNQGALLGGTRGQQLSARFSQITLPRYNLSNTDHMDEWLSLIHAFESALPLLDHKQGTLTDLATYLHDRTGGSIGSLGRLVLGAAIDLIDDPDIQAEALTREVLDAQILDIKAEDHYATRPISAKTTQTTKTTKTTKTKRTQS
ncbi:TniB family NTP-binding protein [Marisediminicola sp. LYQ134]|uniref:TniB family NTP-binding protein n=1 Tax=Marisediminicola sp. LYQ134 TaxID=3391061 RepID=UPI003983D33F